MALDATQVTDNWLVAMARADCEPVILVTIDVDGSTQFKFVSHPGTALAYDASLASISNVSSKIDPVERTFSNNSMTLEFVDDSAIRDIIVNNRLRGKRCIIELGEKTLAEADYAPYFRGIFTDWRGEGGQIVLEASDAYQILIDTIVYNRTWLFKHPLEVIKDILDNVSLVPSELVDSTSLDPDTYTADISHWSVSGNLGKTTWAYPPPVVNCKELVDQLAALCHGGLYPSEEGKLSFTRFDSTDAAQEDWPATEWADLQQVETNTNLVNQAFMQTNSDSPYRKWWKEGTYPRATGIWAMPTLHYTNDDSAGNYAYPGAGTQVMTHRFNTPWVFGFSLISGNQNENKAGIFATNDTTCNININGQAISGLRDDGSSGWAMSSSRLTYLLFYEAKHATRDPHFEVVAFDTRASPPSTDITQDGDAKLVTLTVATNGRKATDATPGATGAQDFDKANTRIWDVTPVIDRLKRVIQRQSEGLPIITVRTNLSHYKNQIGDLVTLSGAPTYVNYGEDGLTGSVKWEIVGKEPNPLGDTPGIKWTLARASIQSGFADTWYPDTTSTYAHADQVGFEDILEGWHNGGFGDIIREGLPVTDSGGLDIDIGRGSAGTKTGLTRYDGTTNLTLPDDATSYVFFNTASRKIEVSSSATVEEGTVRLAKVVTASAAITGITDLRQTFTGTAKPESIGGANGNTLNGAFSLRTRTYHLPDFWEYDAENSTGTYGTDITVGTGGLKTGSNVIAFAATTNVPIVRSGWYPVTEGRLYRTSYSAQTSGTTVNPSLRTDWYQADKITYISSGGITGKGHSASGAQEVHSTTDLAPANARWARLKMKKDAVAESVSWDHVRFDPIPAYALAWEGSNNAISSAAWTRVELDTEVDPANTFNTTSFYWQAPMDSLIDVSACVSASLIGADDLLQCAIYRNRYTAGSYGGTAPKALGCTSQGETSANTVASTVSVVGLEVTQGDRISLWARSPDDTSYTVLAGQSLTYMYVRQVEPRF